MLSSNISGEPFILVPNICNPAGNAPAITCREKVPAGTVRGNGTVRLIASGNVPKLYPDG
jgi:hypothetical protein